MDVYIDIYIDFFLVFTWSHIKCKQHKASHNIIIAGPGPMRPRGPYKAQQCKCYAKQSKASQSNATQCHTTSFPLPVPTETVTCDTVSLSSVAKPAFWLRCCETKCVAKSSVLLINSVAPEGLHITPFSCNHPSSNLHSCCGVAEPVALQSQLCCKTSCVHNMMYDIV